MLFRPDSQRVEVYNEGLCVYLHDPANAAAILKANPPSLLSYSDLEPNKDKALKKLVEAGLIVTYTLRQDDSIRVDVNVGPPLEKTEIKKIGVPLMKPAQTIISLPSGVLRIDTPNSFRLGPDAQAYAEEYEKKHGRPPKDGDLKAFGLEEASGDVRVPPGDYVLTLYRVDFEKMSDREDESVDGEEGESEYDGPGEFIVLTPAKKIERPKKIPCVLEYGAGYPRIAGLRGSKVDNGVFIGNVLSGGIVNFNWKHAARLELRRGQKLDITHDGNAYEAIYLGGVEPRGNHELFSFLYPDELKKLFSQRPGLLTAAVHEESVLKTPLLWLQALEPGKTITAEKGSAIRIAPNKEFLLPAPPAGPIPQGEVDGDTLCGQVLAWGARGVELSCGAKQLRQLTGGKTAEFLLRVGKTSIPLMLLPKPEDRHRPYHIVGSLKSKDEAESFIRIFSYMIEGGDAVFRTCVGEERSIKLVDLLKEYKKGCTFNSRDGYVPKDKKRGAELKVECTRLWREGLSRWDGPGALCAALIPHWDDPQATTLSCRLIKNPGENAFKDVTGQPFELKRGLK